MGQTDNILSSENEIDLVSLANKLWNNRKLIIIISFIGLITGIIIAFSIPKEYTTAVTLAPEASSTQSGNIGSLAAMAGINIQNSTEEAISPELYPNIISSTPFTIGLFDINVKDSQGNPSIDLYTYLSKKQKKAWWSYIFAFPSKLLGLLPSNKQDSILLNTANQGKIELSLEQSSIVESLRSRIHITTDKKTGVITLTSTMQDPNISAFIADTVTTYLQNYIIKYRTEKARQDLAFMEKLYEEAQNSYYIAQQNYTTYLDKNLDIVSARYGATRERLQNEVNLTYGIYSQMAQQLQMAKVKVQGITPAYTIIQPAVVPIIANKPKKKLIVIGFIFIAFIGACSWIIGKDYLNSLKEKE